MTTEEYNLDADEIQGQILVQISALRDRAEEIIEHACGQADAFSLKRKHVRVLKSARSWATYLL